MTDKKKKAADRGGRPQEKHMTGITNGTNPIIPQSTKIRDNLEFSFEQVPEELKQLDQWVVWKREEYRSKKTGEIKVNKIPKQINGFGASTNKSETWTSFQKAEAAYRENDFDGIGFVFGANDPYVGIDLDDIDGWKDKADEIVRTFNSYTEISPSGNGYRIFVKGKKPGKKEKKGPIEMYDYTSTRFLTVTGNHVKGLPKSIEERQPAVDLLYNQFLHDDEPKKEEVINLIPSPDMTDESILAKAMRSKNGEKFLKLYEGDWESFKNEAGNVLYPSQSEADLAFVSLLAFYTQNEEQIDRIFRKSKLYREKWERKDYRKDRIIDKALSSLTSTYQKKQKKASQAEILLELAQKAEYFYTPEGDTYARIKVNDHYEVWRVNSDKFKYWLRIRYSEQEDGAPSSQAIQDTTNQLKAYASFDLNARKNVYVRLAGDFEKIYVDLSNDRWQAVEITAAGWNVTDNPSVLFKRPNDAKSMPLPVHGGDINELRKFVNVSKEQWPLFVSYLVACFHPQGPYPILVLQGTQGSAKSTHTRIIKTLIDPAVSELRNPPKDEKSIAISANNSWCLSYDNLSGLSYSLSDALCRLSTGGALTDRKLYTDDEEQIFNIKRPVILNGIDDIAERGDLGDRATVIQLPSIPEDQRKEEAELWKQFEEAQPRILGAIFDAVSTALRNLPNVKLDKSPRMIDFAKWATAAESAFGLEAGAFIKMYSSNRQDTARTSIDHDVIASGILSLIEDERRAGKSMWEGNSEELLTEIKKRNPSVTKFPHPTRLKSRIERCKPSLKYFGVEIDRGRNRTYIVTQQLEQQLQEPAPASAPTPSVSIYEKAKQMGWQEQEGTLVYLLGNDRRVTIEPDEETFFVWYGEWKPGQLGLGCRPKMAEFIVEEVPFDEALEAASGFIQKLKRRTVK